MTSYDGLANEVSMLNVPVLLTDPEASPIRRQSATG